MKKQTMAEVLQTALNNADALNAQRAGEIREQVLMTSNQLYNLHKNTRARIDELLNNHVTFRSDARDLLTDIQGHNKVLRDAVKQFRHNNFKLDHIFNRSKSNGDELTAIENKISALDDIVCGLSVKLDNMQEQHTKQANEARTVYNVLLSEQQGMKHYQVVQQQRLHDIHSFVRALFWSAVIVCSTIICVSVLVWLQS